MEHSRQCDRLQDPRRRCRQKIKEHYVGASTLMQDRYHFWVQMAQADQTSISALETAVRTQADVRSVQMLFLFGFNESFSRFREDIYRDGQRKPKDPLFTLAFVVSQAVSFEAAQQTNKLLAHSPGSAIKKDQDQWPKSPSSDATPTGISCLCKTSTISTGKPLDLWSNYRQYNPPLVQHQNGQFRAPLQPGPVASSRNMLPSNLYLFR